MSAWSVATPICGALALWTGSHEYDHNVVGETLTWIGLAFVLTLTPAGICAALGALLGHGLTMHIGWHARS
jgi:hypothetical protein